jgi:hypothetical protein
MLDCLNRVKELRDDETFVQSAVNSKLGTYKDYNLEEIETSEALKQFKIREGIN